MCGRFLLGRRQLLFLLANSKGSTIAPRVSAVRVVAAPAARSAATARLASQLPSLVADGDAAAAAIFLRFKMQQQRAARGVDLALMRVVVPKYYPDLTSI